MSLAEKKVHHRKAEEKLSETEIEAFRAEVPTWGLFTEEGTQHMRREFEFDNFAQALEFTNLVAELAETHNHHPQLTTEWGAVTVDWWTHTVSGLSENDFIMAAKTDLLFTKRAP
ncbi:MAG: 4a-hydroxytetrahydrobiopterin dehydratase [Chloroflexi bacterium]|nr:4a-hydroxytetrahydrobiopterin dehydratase [Chloroflexota bacterium]